MAFPFLRHTLSAEPFALETISCWISSKHNQTTIKSSSYKEIKAQVKDHYHAPSNGAHGLNRQESNNENYFFYHKSVFIKNSFHTQKNSVSVVTLITIFNLVLKYTLHLYKMQNML